MKKQNKIQLLDIVPVIILVGLFVVFAVSSKGATLSGYNLQLLFTNVVPVLIGSLGCIFVIALGGTDISIGASAALCASVASILTENTAGWVAIPVTLGLSTAFGAFIGWICMKFKVPSFMCTLAILIAARGLLNFLLQQRTIPAPHNVAFASSFGFVIVLLVVLIIIVWFVFDHTKFGFYCKCIGENEKTVRSVGINVNRIRVICFMISGLMAGIVGFIQICRVGGSASSLCNLLEMRVQMAIFLGGILTTGGFTAKIHKIVIGSFTIAIIENGMTVLGVSSQVSEAIEGIVLVGILITTVYCNKVAVNNDLKMAAMADRESIKAVAEGTVKR